MSNSSSELAKSVRSLSGKNIGYQLTTFDWNLLTESVAQLADHVADLREKADFSDTPPS